MRKWERGVEILMLINNFLNIITFKKYLVAQHVHISSFRFGYIAILLNHSKQFFSLDFYTKINVF